MLNHQSVYKLVLSALPALAMLMLAVPATAHIQVSPPHAAPGDAVKFTVLVPNESEAVTTKVELKIPSGMLPFSYVDVPGWKRTLVEASNGSVEEIVWTGKLAQDGFVEFSFLAGTPEKPMDLQWKALQSYSDGNVVSWIGAPDTEYPAAVTHLDENAAKQNAGGESSGDTSAEKPASASTTKTSGSQVAGPAESDKLARIVAAAGLVAGLMALVLGGWRRRPANR